jgi:hypothetical protein
MEFHLPLAYIDPGTTSLVLQGLIGGIAAVLVLTRSWWLRAASRFRPSRGASPEDGPDNLAST